jgi:multiple antibiotic resistance protein
VDLFARAFVTILVIMDPVGGVPVFLSLTRAQTSAQRRRSALQAMAVAAAVILAFAAAGQQVLHYLGISIEALRVSGGLILVLVALELLRPSGSGTVETAAGGNVALVPLGTPMLAGPGAIAATMIYVRAADGPAQVATVVGALIAVLLVVLVALLAANRIARLLGANGIDLASRLVGLLLAAIAVQMVAAGVQAWVREGVH